MGRGRGVKSVILRTFSEKMGRKKRLWRVPFLFRGLGRRESGKTESTGRRGGPQGFDSRRFRQTNRNGGAWKMPDGL